MNVKQTVIKTTNPKTGKPQFWQVRPKDYNTVHTNNLIRSFSVEPNMYDVDNAIKRTRNYTKEDLRFIPLSTTGKDEPVSNRNQYRGFENDTEPFVVRKKELGEIEAIMQVYPEDHLFFKSYSYDKHLTDGQKKWLEESFQQQIISQITDDLLQEVKDNWESYIIDYAKSAVVEIRTQLDKIEAYTGPSK